MQTLLEYSKHLPEGLRREEHLHANGLGVLWDIVGGGAVTIATARWVVAKHFYGVSERTLGRKLTRQRIDESRDLAELRVAALEALGRDGHAEVASDRYSLRLTMICSPRAVGSPSS